MNSRTNNAEKQTNQQRMKQTTKKAEGADRHPAREVSRATRESGSLGGGMAPVDIKLGALAVGLLALVMGAQVISQAMKGGAE
jgi:hypothetical protein